MQIMQAKGHQLPSIVSFYDTMCQVMQDQPFLPNGNRGGFPSRAMVAAAIRDGHQFIGIEDGQIIAAYILNHDCDDAYRSAPWQIRAPDQAVGIVHALRVLPQYSGRGYAKQLMTHGIQIARQNGYQAIRLDCLKENTIPARLYTSLGFQYVTTVDITYADIGVSMPCLLYELIL